MFCLVSANENFNFFLYWTYTKNSNNLFSYLAVVAGLCAEADYVFVPEDPPKIDWQKKLCQQLQQARQLKMHSSPIYIFKKFLIFLLIGVKLAREKKFKILSLKKSYPLFMSLCQ